MNNKGDFDNLVAAWYWSETELASNPVNAWGFSTIYGFQIDDYVGSNRYGLAVRSGQVSAAPVPEPATMLLFGIGLAGLAGSRIRRKK